MQHPQPENYTGRKLLCSEEGNLQSKFLKVNSLDAVSQNKEKFPNNGLSHFINQEDPNVEDIYIMKIAPELAEKFLKAHLVIWHDVNEDEKEVETCINLIQKNWTAIKPSNRDEVLKLIQDGHSNCTLITSTSTGENFVKEMNEESDVLSIFLYGQIPHLQDEWKAKYGKVVPIKDSLQSIVKLLDDHIPEAQKKKSSFLKTNLPVFSPIFDDSDKTYNNYLNIYLKGLIYFKNRLQAKNDFHALAKTIYHDNTDIENIDKFALKYTSYDMKQILKWYSKESFFYKLINNSLRISEVDTILYCRLPLKDLETAIKDQYRIKSQDFNGLLYRGAYISDKEWEQLRQNHDKDIEMYGFLSTTKIKDVAIGFLQENRRFKIFITIIVPPTIDAEGQGFAEIKEFSINDYEDEVLFNIRSRFTVLSTNMEELDGVEFRHVVLLYGGRRIKRHLKLQDPSINMKIDTQNINDLCCICSAKISGDDQLLFFVNPSNVKERVCLACIMAEKMIDIPVLASVPLFSEEALEKPVFDMRIKGIIATYKEKLEIPFYGYTCSQCKNDNIKRHFVCETCKDQKKQWCNQCFKMPNGCLDAQHTLVIENQPFTFWNEKMTDYELAHFEYEYPIYNQGTVFLETQENQKSIEYFEKRLHHGANSQQELGYFHECLGIAHMELGDLPKAIQNLSKSLEIIKLIYGEKDSQTAISYNNLALAYKESGKADEAITYFLRALNISIQVYGENDYRTATYYNNLGSAYNKAGKIEKAVDVYLKGLEINRKFYGEYHPQTGSSYNNVGEAYRKSVQPEKALEYFEKALKVRKAIYGDQHPQTAVTYNNIGTMFAELNRSEKAIINCRKALEVTISAYGERHPQTAIAYHNIGEIYQRFGKPKEAAEYLSKALELSRFVNKEEHPQTAIYYNNLGLAYQQLGRLNEAMECHINALRIAKLVHGEQHPETAAFYDGLGLLYQEMKKIQKAKEHFEKALQIRKSIYGEDVLQAGDSYNNLGLVSQDFGQHKQAIGFYGKSLESHGSKYGNQHINTATAHNNLGEALRESGQPQLAKDHYLKAIEAFKLQFGDQHPSVGTCYNNLGLAYQALGQHRKALEYVLKALEIRKEVYGDYNQETAVCYNNAGLLNQELGQMEKAFEYYLKSLKIKKIIYGEKHPTIATTYNNLGTAYLAADQLDKAIDFFLESLEIKKANYGENHRSMIATCNNVGTAYQRKGQLDKAISYFIKALQLQKMPY